MHEATPVACSPAAYTSAVHARPLHVSLQEDLQASEAYHRLGCGIVHAKVPQGLAALHCLGALAWGQPSKSNNIRPPCSSSRVSSSNARWCGIQLVFRVPQCS